MFESFQFEGHIEGNYIVPDVPLNLPENMHVRARLEKVEDGKGEVQIRKGTQDFSGFFGSLIAPSPIGVGNLLREEIYRDDD